ncbi:superoxide dismutase family protein [Oceanobacillus piezotolerans]|uniref:Superoxide dismutase family protein n=1 Tax=Oceanobacillus piezotolerans TaxID=2448030 RepID=A0A498D7Z0_9BACI|nr:superoxide dismutase family protein [Oceanobacillus piezotolerans]RLL46483.1 superoxide dismutase family protein [Oceanobacillus piezotolerans]
MRFILLSISLITLAACQGENDTNRTVDMYNTSGDMVGTVELADSSDGVNVKIKLEGLEPGFHGIHVHEFPKCEPPSFESAGNHFNPDGSEHGLMHPKGAHLGDLPNIEADGGGLVDAELMLPGATLLDGKNSLLRGDGTSIVVHEVQDDGVSQPSGESGARILCGELKANSEENKGESPTNPTENNKELKE